MYSRRSGRHSTADHSAGPSRSRRAAPDEQSAKRKQHTSNGGHSSRQRRRVVEEEEEEEEEGREEEEGGHDAGGSEEEEDDDEGGGEEQNGEDVSDGGVWDTIPPKKLKVTPSAKRAAEQLGSEAVKRKANDLARLALFSEHRRTALKREDITKKVLDKASSKAFPIIFNRAQKVLRYTFGYEMVELRARGTDSEQIWEAGKTQAEGEGEEEADRGKGAMSKSYILRSILPAKVIAKMAAPNHILSASTNEVDGEPFDSDGIMVDWKRSSSDLCSMGLLFFILSLILLNGRSIPDDTLRSYLRRMSLDPHKTLPRVLQPNGGKDSNETGLTMDDYLDTLLKQSYLECSRSAAASGQGAMSMEASMSGKRVQARGRKSRGEEGEGKSGEENEWRWGARAEAEISEKAVANFVAEIYVDAEEVGQHESQRGEIGEDGEENEEEPGRRKKQEQLLKHIEQVAGSQLIV